MLGRGAKSGCEQVPKVPKILSNQQAPLRRFVARLVSFGIEPARVDDGLIELLRTQDASV